MIKLLDIAKEVRNEDRCKRIADRKYDKPSAYKSGAIVRCRKGNIWKGLKEEIDQLDEKKKKPFAPGLNAKVHLVKQEVGLIVIHALS